MKILFVCTANIARSPYAEQRMRAMADSSTGLTFASAGIPGYPGRSIDNNIATVLAERGVEPSEHTSRVLDDAAVTDTDLILTMEFAHQLSIMDSWPAAATKVFGLRQFANAAQSLMEDPARVRDAAIPELLLGAQQAARPNSMTLNVPDPYRRGVAATRKAADQIDEALEDIFNVIRA